MGLHSLLITNTQGMLLLARYFDDPNDARGSVGGGGAFSQRLPISAGEGMIRDRAAAMRLWEREVLLQTRHMWDQAALDGAEHVARAKGDVFIVFRAIHGVLVFLCGFDEFDELTLAETLKSFVDVLAALCAESGKHAKAFEPAILTGDVYGKVFIAIDEMMGGGILEATDQESVLCGSKLKPLVA
ncbi:unnamed protein product [Phaeothamnion confervicola]